MGSIPQRRWLSLLTMVLLTFVGVRFAAEGLYSPSPVQAHAVSSATRLLDTREGKRRDRLQAIETIRLGQRVLGTNPVREEVTEVPSKPDSAGWRAVHLEMTHGHSGKLEIELLRPLAWLNAQNGEVGAIIHLDLPEMGAEGPATIVAIKPCPTIESGPGQLVTGRFAHPASNVVDVKLRGSNEIIGTTDNHPFWSATRRDWVEAGKLLPGEELEGITGTPLVVESVLPRPGPGEHVYNIEVDSEHVYRVGYDGTLVHNQYAQTFKNFNAALGAGLKWLEARGFDATKAAPHTSKFTGKTNGLMQDGNIGYRIEFDARTGAHIDFFAGKEKISHLKFPGNENAVNAILRQLFEAR